MVFIRCPLCRKSDVTLNNIFTENDMCPVCFEDTCCVLTCNHHLCYKCFSNISTCHENSLPVQNTEILIVDNNIININRVNNNIININRVNDIIENIISSENIISENIIYSTEGFINALNN